MTKSDANAPVDAYRFPRKIQPGCQHNLGCKCEPPFYLRPSSPAEEARFERMQHAFSGAPVPVVEHEKGEG